MDVSIVGASGGYGWKIVTQTVQQRQENRKTLQPAGSSPRPHLLNGLSAELNAANDPKRIIGEVAVTTRSRTIDAVAEVSCFVGHVIAANLAPQTAAANRLLAAIWTRSLLDEQNFRCPSR
ncbi:MAG: hypothetical protein FWF31_05760 [Desulfobulbus sp.]|nr:hypothetical protein [Desulfobulbus sp.]